MFAYPRLLEAVGGAGQLRCWLRTLYHAFRRGGAPP